MPKPGPVATEFRLLTSNDVALMKAMLALFGDAFGDVATYQKAVPSCAYLAGLLAKPHFIALAALAEGKLVGGLAAYVLDKFEQDRREIYIYDLAVLDSFRRQRTGTGLITELRAIAKARDAYVIFVQADRGDEPAIALYQSMGMREDVVHFDFVTDDTKT